MVQLLAHVNTAQSFNRSSQSRLLVRVFSPGDQLHQPKPSRLLSFFAAARRAAGRPSTRDPVRSAAERRTPVSAAATVRPSQAPRSGVASARGLSEPARQQAEEGLFEGLVEDGVDDWVEDAGGVAKPEKPLRDDDDDDDDDYDCGDNNMKKKKENEEKEK